MAIKKSSQTSLKRPDITSPNQLREQAKFFRLGKLQGRAKWWQVIASLVALSLFAVLATVAVVKVMWSTPGIDASKYQAVFLEDGKVFFGKLHNTDGAYITVENAFYTRSSQTTGNSSTSPDQTALIEVGSESYGPENNIQIARSKILFWQNLRSDSQVATAITNRVNK